jgi:hypothetical protein
VDRGIHLVYFNKLLDFDKAGQRALLDVIPLRDADVSIGQVMSEPLDIIQAFTGIYAGNLFPLFISIVLNGLQGAYREGRLDPVASPVKPKTLPGPLKV